MIAISKLKEAGDFPMPFLHTLTIRENPRNRLLAERLVLWEPTVGLPKGRAVCFDQVMARLWKIDGASLWFQRQFLALISQEASDILPPLPVRMLTVVLEDTAEHSLPDRLRFIESVARLTPQLPIGDEYRSLLSTPSGQAVALAVLVGKVESRRSGDLSSSELFRPGAEADILNTAVKTAEDGSTVVEQRRLAIRAVALQRKEEAAPLLERIIDQDPSPELVSAAISALGNYRDPAIADVLLAGWPQATPALRRARLDVLLSRREYAEPVVAALEAKELAAADFDAINADRLLRLCDEAQRARAEPLLKRNVDANRAQVIASLQPALQLTGDSARGSQVFVQNCKTCHAVRGVGNRIGPDLASVANRPPADVLVDILDPSRNVAADGMSYVVSVKDGRILSGLLGGENATSITLKRAEGEDIILRSEIEELRNTGRSLMPEGLEKNLNEQAFADLLTFLKKGEPPPTK